MIYKRATAFLWLWVYCLLASFTPGLLASPKLDPSVEAPTAYTVQTYHPKKNHSQKAGSKPLTDKYSAQEHLLLSYSSAQTSHWYKLNNGTQYQYADSSVNGEDTHLLNVYLSSKDHAVTSQSDWMYLPLIKLDSCSQQTFWVKQHGASHQQLSHESIYDFTLSDSQLNNELNITIYKDKRNSGRSKYKESQNHQDHIAPSKVNLRSYYENKNNLFLCEITLYPHQLYDLIAGKEEKVLSSLAFFQSNPWLNRFKVSLSPQVHAESRQPFISIKFQPKDESESNPPITDNLKPIVFEKDATVIIPEQGGFIVVNPDIYDASQPVTVKITDQASGSYATRAINYAKQLLSAEKLKSLTLKPEDAFAAKLVVSVAGPVLMAYTPFAPAAFLAPVFVFHGGFITSYLLSKCPSLPSSKKNSEGDIQSPEEEVQKTINQVRAGGGTPLVLIDLLAVLNNGSSTEFTLVPTTGLDSDPQPSLLNIIQAKNKETLSLTFNSLLEYTGDLKDLPAYIQEILPQDNLLQSTSADLNITEPAVAINEAIQQTIKEKPQAKSSIALIECMLDSAHRNPTYQTAIALLSGYKLHAPNSKEVELLFSSLDASKISKSKCIIALEQVVPKQCNSTTKQARASLTRTSPSTGAAIMIGGTTILSCIQGSIAAAIPTSASDQATRNISTNTATAAPVTPAPTIDPKMQDTHANTTATAPVTTTTTTITDPPEPSYFKTYFVAGQLRQNLRHICTREIGYRRDGVPVLQTLPAPGFCEQFDIANNQDAARYMKSFFEIREVQSYGCTPVHKTISGTEQQSSANNYYGKHTIQNGTSSLDDCLSQYATDKCSMLVKQGAETSTNNDCYVCESASSPLLRCGYQPTTTTEPVTTTTVLTESPTASSLNPVLPSAETTVATGTVAAVASQLPVTIAGGVLGAGVGAYVVGAYGYNWWNREEKTWADLFLAPFTIPIKKCFSKSTGNYPTGDQSNSMDTIEGTNKTLLTEKRKPG